MTAATAQELHPDLELVIDRVFDAPRELVFKAWTDPRMALNWWGPRDYPARSVELDAKPGGKWRCCLRSVETGEDIWQGGIVRDIAPPERIVFTFAWEENGKRGRETLVTITFAEERGGTRVRLRQAPFDTADNRDGHRGGWNSALDRLVELVTPHVP